MNNLDANEGLFDLEEALKAKLHLGDLASSLLQGAQIVCTDVELLKLNVAGRVLQSQAADFQALANAIEVLERRSLPVTAKR
jgi:hypothetical protein